MTIVHQPTVAGVFYPGKPEELQKAISALLGQVSAEHMLPKAIIAPHAGYQYSGLVAASAYACLRKAKNSIKRVVILAPAHRYPFFGVATSAADIFVTPLGKLALDRQSLDAKKIKVVDEAFRQEHSIEVQLPFLQVVLGEFELLPLLVGKANAQEIAGILEAFWGGDETLIVISSDLSHYHSYTNAKERDSKTAAAILNLTVDDLTSEDACGYLSIQGLVRVIKKYALKPSLVDLRNSGDTSGQKEQVVGYGAFHFEK